MSFYRIYLVFATSTLVVVLAHLMLARSDTLISPPAMPTEQLPAHKVPPTPAEDELPDKPGSERRSLRPRLVIPSIQVDAAVRSVGISYRGNMAVPESYDDVGWYRLGPSPGDPGNAVIAGHVDNGYRRLGVFKRLDDLAPGDTIDYSDERGSVTFVVTEVATYPYQEAPRERIFADAGPAQLVLITCGGTWVPETKSYTERVIVFAKRHIFAASPAAAG